MNVTVQSYLLKENEGLVFDAEEQDAWKRTVEEMGLEGQMKLTRGKDSPIPFLWMNRRLRAVFSFLCPRSEKVVEYGKMPIPLEALSLIALAEKEKYFGEIRVWYDDVKGDPIAVGTAEDKELYLIARWGAENKSLERLEKEARERCEVDTRGALERKAQECKNRLATLDSVVEERMNGGYFYA